MSKETLLVQLVLEVVHTDEQGNTIGSITSRGMI
jgi:hypothetical protein